MACISSGVPLAALGWLMVAAAASFQSETALGRPWPMTTGAGSTASAAPPPPQPLTSDTMQTRSTSMGLILKTTDRFMTVIPERVRREGSRS